MKISAILDQIDLGAIVFPEFQQGYVWNRNQVRGLMQSLYYRYPIGSLLVWKIQMSGAVARGGQGLQPGSVKLLLEGQQRITSLYGLIRGKAPDFFEGNDGAFTDLCFHLKEEKFAFYQPSEMRDDHMWIDVTELFEKGADNMIQEPEKSKWLDRLNRIVGIKEIDLHIQEASGEDKTTDVVVDFFNCVNSDGRTLSEDDIAWAYICAAWPEARRQINDYLKRWKEKGYDFTPQLFLRTATTVLTGKVSALEGVDNKKINNGFEKASKHIDTLLDLIGSRLGLDHDRVLGGRYYALPLMARYLEQREGAIDDPNERDKLLYWYINSFLCVRYTGDTKSILKSTRHLKRDLRLIKKPEGGLDRLIDELHTHGDNECLSLEAKDFEDCWNCGSCFYPLLYMLTLGQALDWETEVELKSHLLGKLSQIELHHIFPHSSLDADKRTGKSKRMVVNDLANLTFLTHETQRKLSKQKPADYLAHYAPELLDSHCIPRDSKLWQIDQYNDFLTERRKLLAGAANKFLNKLFPGHVPK